jgi:hypothetical protein
MGAWSVRAIIFSAVISFIPAGFALAQTAARPPVGGIGELPDAMIFYVAHGAADACGPGCSEWIAAEGIVEWDTLKRLIAILDRQAPRKLPVVIHDRGGDLKISTNLGRILRGRGIDTTVGTTEVEACDGKSEADCFALKRQGGRSTPGSTCRSRAAILPASCFWPVVSIAACHRAHGSC